MVSVDNFPDSVRQCFRYFKNTRPTQSVTRCEFEWPNLRKERASFCNGLVVARSFLAKIRSTIVMDHNALFLTCSSQSLLTLHAAVISVFNVTVLNIQYISFLKSCVTFRYQIGSNHD